jgi:hypothetical protein
MVDAAAGCGSGAELWGADRVIRVPDSVTKAVIAAGE